MCGCVISLWVVRLCYACVIYLFGLLVTGLKCAHPNCVTTIIVIVYTTCCCALSGRGIANKTSWQTLRLNDTHFDDPAILTSGGGGGGIRASRRSSSSGSVK